MGSERVAHHVDGFEVEAFAVPFLVHVESEPVFEVTNDAAGVDGAAIGDAGGLPSSHLRVEQRLQGHDGHMVVDLVPDRFAADDAVFAADRFDAVEVCDPGVEVSAFAYLVGDPFGEAV